jgi:hypothetical protein
MKKKRVRESSSAEEEEDGGGSARAPEKANEFGQWLLENIYKHAEVRDSEELAKLKRQRDDLLEALRQVVDDSSSEYPWFCACCGDTRVIETRGMCGRCSFRFVPCSKCVPGVCSSQKHKICGLCEEDDEEEDIPNCTGVFPYFCGTGRIY